MESDDEKQETGSCFKKKRCGNESDIILDVIEHNRQWDRPHRVSPIYKRRNKAVCTQDDCLYVVQFTFLHTFGPAIRFTTLLPGY